MIRGLVPFVVLLWISYDHENHAVCVPLGHVTLFASLSFLSSWHTLPVYGDSGSSLRDRRLVRRFSFLIFDDVLNDNWDTKSNNLSLM